MTSAKSSSGINEQRQFHSVRTQDRKNLYALLYRIREALYVMPQRTPGARLAGGVGRVAAIEAVNLGWVTVENAAGAREVVRFTPALGDSPSRAELPPWLLGAGENHLQLRWPGGSGEVTITRHDLPMVPADGAPALLGGTLPVVSVR